jgi:hypothetical protein
LFFLVEPIPQSDHPSASIKIEFSASDTKMNSQIVPLVSSNWLELVHQLDESTQLFLGEALGTTGSSLGF